MSACRLRAALMCVAFVLLFTYSAAAQSLTVRVVDPAGGAVSGATVTVLSRYPQLPVRLVTDGNGRAIARALAAGSYVLQIDALGFTRAVRTIDIGGDSASIAVVLAIARIQEHVMVTAADRPQASTEVAKALSVIDAAEMQWRNVFVVADAVRTSPGANVQQLGGPGAFASIKIRGLREQDTAMLIDGVRFRDGSSPQGDAAAFAGELYVTNLDRVELLRGSASSLYGSHAIGGAVNMITRSGFGRPAADISVEAGGLEFRRATAHAGGGAFNGRLGMSAGMTHAHVGRGVDGDDEARNTSGQGRVDLRLWRSAHTFVRLYGSDADSTINESPAAIGPLPSSGFVHADARTFVPAANDPDSRRASSFLSLLMRFEQRASSRLGYSISFHRLRTDRTFLDGPRGGSTLEPSSQTTSRFGGRIDTLDSRVDVPWTARHTTAVSYEFEREQYGSQSLPVNRALAWDADITQHSQTLSMHHEMRLDVVSVSAGVRGQRFALQSVTLAPAERAPFAAQSFVSPPSALTGDVAVAKWLTRTNTKLRAHAGNGYRAPAMFERAGVSFGSQGYRVFGDPGIASERSVSIDAGVDQILLRGRLHLSATAFRTRLHRVITFRSLNRTVDPLGRSSGYTSADGRTVQGVELEVQMQPHPTMQTRLAYTFVDAPAPAGGADGMPRAHAITAQQFTGLVLQQLNRVQLSFTLHVSGDHFVPLFDPLTFGSRAYRFHGTAKVDVSAHYEMSRGRMSTRLFATAENLLDRTYFVQGFPVPGRIARGGLAVRF